MSTSIDAAIIKALVDHIDKSSGPSSGESSGTSSGESSGTSLSENYIDSSKLEPCINETCTGTWEDNTLTFTSEAYKPELGDILIVDLEDGTRTTYVCVKFAKNANGATYYYSDGLTSTSKPHYCPVNYKSSDKTLTIGNSSFCLTPDNVNTGFFRIKTTTDLTDPLNYFTRMTKAIHGMLYTIAPTAGA